MTLVWKRRRRERKNRALKMYSFMFTIFMDARGRKVWCIRVISQSFISFKNPFFPLSSLCLLLLFEYCRKNLGYAREEVGSLWNNKRIIFIFLCKRGKKLKEQLSRTSPRRCSISQVCSHIWYKILCKTYTSYERQAWQFFLILLLRIIFFSLEERSACWLAYAVIAFSPFL